MFTWVRIPYAPPKAKNQKSTQIRKKPEIACFFVFSAVARSHRILRQKCEIYADFPQNMTRDMTRHDTVSAPLSLPDMYNSHKPTPQFLCKYTKISKLDNFFEKTLDNYPDWVYNVITLKDREKSKKPERQIP